MIQVYGIPNCDTVKKAMAWLKENDVAFDFHDFKKEGITALKLQEWLKTASFDQVLNKKSIAYKNLTDDEKQRTNVKAELIKLMQANTNLIKRPVMEIGGIVLNGFTEDNIKNALAKNK